MSCLSSHTHVQDRFLERTYPGDRKALQAMLALTEIEMFRQVDFDEVFVFTFDSHGITYSANLCFIAKRKRRSA
jgi:hypothetical protein